jgi:dTDP-4-amino-4,6-dideoxygalactose transaminase
MKMFDKSFTQQEPIPDDAIDRAVAVLRSGRLHRYNTLAEETSETALLEQDFARYQGSRYCLACTSGGYALQIALRSVGVGPGDRVLCNGWTLAPVPGAIHSSGAEIVLVETAADCTIDLDDLAAKAKSSGARYLLLSHMRGHLVDMDRLMEVCTAYDLCLIEDCAHTMGARWGDQLSGSFGVVACFSTQTYKHLNSGEGGLLVSDDAEIMARAVVHSGSYMLFDRHGAAPDAGVYDSIRYQTPNLSGRMDNLRAAILRPQLADLDRQCQRWNALYRVLEAGLGKLPGVRLPHRSPHEHFVGSSIQFSVPDLDAARIQRLVAACERRGVQLKWFGEAQPRGYTSRYDSWRYLGELEPLPRTMKLLSTLLDMRVPLIFNTADCELIVEIIAEELELTEASQ